MSIRRKIVLSNLLMILVPLFLVAIMGCLWLNTAGKRYWQPIEEMYEERNGVISAQSLIYAYQEELWDTDWVQLEGSRDPLAGGGDLSSSPEMARLQKDLTDLGYHFTVLLNDETLYSNLSQQEWRQVENLIGPIPEQANFITVGNDNISVIKCSFYENGEECSIIAASTEVGILGSASYLQRYVIPYIWIFGGCTVLVIFLVNLCCSKWIHSLIIPPMKEIRRGMQKVKEGELDGEIRIYRRDELGEVSEEFNEMQWQLKRSREEQMKYEAYRRELISSISHDLRTPLTTIKGYIGGILDGIANTEEMRKKYLLAVQTRTADLEHLVNQLSAYNQMENHVFRYEMETVDRILIIEDDELIAELERDYLLAEGMEADIAGTGLEGMKWFHKRAYVAVLLDLMLPGKGGFEICREIREISDVPILLVTAKNEDIDKMKGLGDTSTVTVHIKKLREKIEDDPSNPQLIKTVWGVGYRFQKPDLSQ